MMILAISIFIHKIPVGFTLGFLFEQSNCKLSEKFTWIVMFLFVITTPVGVAVGAVISTFSNLVLAIIQSLAGGTFIYLACCDFIIHEF